MQAMTRGLLVGLLLVLPGLAPDRVRLEDAGFPALPGRSDTVHVAPATGERTTDRASILAALERATPGDTILFARGMYLVGRVIPVSTPGLTLLGHSQGTTLRGTTEALMRRPS
jgi:hypothetical protein